MLQALAHKWGVDLAASYVVGDSWKDMEAGRAAGCRTVLLRRDYNGDASALHEVGTLMEAAELIVAGGMTSYAQRYLAESRLIIDALDPAALDAMAEGGTRATP
jgi:beta-phosphoglucomutase-like phosphatase (HAD superfamily)